MHVLKVSIHPLLKVCFLLNILLFSNASYSQTHNLTLVFNNIDAIEGELSIGIFKNEKTFLDEGNEYKKLILKVDGSSVRHTVALPEGEYAISVYHDKNTDKECNRNFFGIPTESYGFSNNIKPKLSAPKFHQCKFNITDDIKHTIELQN